MEDETWLTAKEAALFVGVDIQTVSPWIRRGHREVTRLNHRGRNLFRHLDVAKAELVTRTKAGRLLVPAT
ncbi:hypothetical protein OG806_02255 [Streptomyces sp. NBC_00882]|uniref:hypothetical protein n=1 Tax=Streptomyces TaxID=1883 RepID=UPI00386B476F|nr:hypothetical protein OG806_02255 [Streptomyces sp. NBC_00882]WSZ55372.1 hypothetical protein OH824_01830 [Streptomyces canus]